VVRRHFDEEWLKRVTSSTAAHLLAAAIPGIAAVSWAHQAISGQAEVAEVHESLATAEGRLVIGHE
jgi:hypothetical protein